MRQEDHSKLFVIIPRWRACHLSCLFFSSKKTKKERKGYFWNCLQLKKFFLLSTADAQTMESRVFSFLFFLPPKKEKYQQSWPKYSDTKITYLSLIKCFCKFFIVTITSQKPDEILYRDPILWNLHMFFWNFTRVS